MFEDTDGDGRSEASGTFFEGTKQTMSLAFARDGSLFVATRCAIYRLEDRDGDGRADGEAARAFPRRWSGSTRRATIRTTACPASPSTSRATSTSAWARTSAPITG